MTLCIVQSLLPNISWKARTVCFDIIMSSICSQVEITAVWTDICSKFTRTPKMPYHRYRSKLQGGEKLSEPVRDQLPAHHQGETTRQSPGPGLQVSVAVKLPVVLPCLLPTMSGATG